MNQAARVAILTVFTVLAPLISAVACGDSDSAGVTIAVDLEAPTANASRAGVTAGTWTTDLGFQIELEKAYLATGSIEILPCKNAALNLFAIREAHAHSEGSPTRLGIPVVESLLATGGTRVHMGTLEPPPATYCTARYAVNAADGDALGLPGDVDMVGRSFYARGTFARAGEAPRTFEMSSSKSMQIDLPFAEAALSAEPSRPAAVVVRKIADHWFDGVDFTTTTPTQQADLVLERVGQSLRVAKL